MKRTFSVLVVAFLAVSVFSSCEKCTTCEIKDGDTVITTYPETCGSASDIDDFKATVDDANKVYEDAGFDYEIVCEDD